MAADEIVHGMLSKDPFSQWLGLSIDAIDMGYCKLHYTVRHDMLNGFLQLHGGVLFAAADAAFAFACNTHGRLSVALEASISFVRPGQAGDILYVEAMELHLGNKTGLYEIRTTDTAGNLLALFKGTAYRSSKPVLS